MSTPSPTPISATPPPTPPATTTTAWTTPAPTGPADFGVTLAMERAGGDGGTGSGLRFERTSDEEGTGSELLAAFFHPRLGPQRLAFILDNLATPWLPLQELNWRMVYLTYFMAYVNAELPARFEDHLRVFLGLGCNNQKVPLPTVPAFFWSDGAEFLEAGLNIARVLLELNHHDPELMDIERMHRYICAMTQEVRRKLEALGAFVGWLPLDFSPDSRPPDSDSGLDTVPYKTKALGIPDILHLSPALWRLPSPEPILTTGDAFWDGSHASNVFSKAAVKTQIFSNPYPHTVSLTWWRAYLPILQGPARWYFSTMAERTEAIGLRGYFTQTAAYVGEDSTEGADARSRAAAAAAAAAMKRFADELHSYFSLALDELKAHGEAAGARPGEVCALVPRW